jgi:RimJ/RimL family protein N-acetyltransferase
MIMAKRSLSPIVDGPVTLRLLEERDLAMTRAWRNQDEIRKWFLTSGVISEGQHAAWFAQYRDRDDDFVFIIEETATLKKPIGQVSVYAIEWDRGRAKFGRLLIGDADARGRGLAKRAVATLVAHAEHVFGLDELRLEVLAGNEPAIAIYESCGFSLQERHDGQLIMVRMAADGRSKT